MIYEEQRRYALKLFKGAKYKELRAAVKADKCFRDLSPTAENAGAIEYWNEFLDEWKYRAGREWSGVTDAMRIEAFSTLEGKWKYYAGLDWSGVTDEMRVEAFSTLKGEWKYRAGRDWPGVTDEMRVEE